MPYEEPSKAVPVTNMADAKIIKISVQNGNPQLAAKICKTIPEIFSAEVQRILKASGLR